MACRDGDESGISNLHRQDDTSVVSVISRGSVLVTFGRVLENHARFARSDCLSELVKAQAELKQDERDFHAAGEAISRAEAQRDLE